MIIPPIEIHLWDAKKHAREKRFWVEADGSLGEIRTPILDAAQREKRLFTGTKPHIVPLQVVVKTSVWPGTALGRRYRCVGRCVAGEGETARDAYIAWRVRDLEALFYDVCPEWSPSRFARARMVMQEAN